MKTNVPQISLRSIDRDNFQQILALHVSPLQSAYILDNAYSLAQAGVQPECIPLGIYLGDRPIGFCMYCVDREEKEYWIYRFMVDRRQQSKGYGRAALNLLLQRIRQDTNRHHVYLSFEPQNTWAQRLYQKMGFVSDGRVSFGELVYRLDY